MPRIDEFKLLADVCRQSLAQFVREFWFVVNPGNPIQWNFHVEHMCSEVQAVYERVFAKKPKLYDLVYNISPGTSKSTVFSIMAPAWAWTRMPHFCFIGASYSEELAWELAGKNRDVVKSELYQKCFPDIKIRSDQDSLSKFVNTKMGYRYAVGSNTNVTGKHGDLLGVDDPINPKQVLSEATLWGVNHWLRNTLNSRVKDKTISAMTMVMQRLHQDDPTAQMIRRKRVRHICLPATTEFPIKPPELKKFYKDGLMDPVRLPQEYLDEERSPFAMGEAGYATQFGQSPTPIGGSMFRVDKLKWGRPPEQFKRLVRFWDKAASISSGNNPKSRGPAFTVGTKMGLDLEDRLWVLDVDRRRLDSFDRERLIKRTALRDGKECEVGQEQEPGPIWEEELVQLSDGRHKKLKNIRVGDWVMNKSGKPTRVLAVHEQGLLGCLSIKTDSGRIIRASQEHPFLTPTGWKTASELRVGDCLALKSRMTTRPSSEPSLEECRLAGYFIGDGCCTWQVNSRGERTNTCNAMVTCSDDVQGEDIAHCGQSVGACVKRRGKNRWIYGMSEGIRLWLKRVGLAGKATADKDVPRWIKSASDECVANFIGAFFSCDGTISHSKGGVVGIEFYNTSWKLLRGIQSLLLRFGVYSRLRSRTYQPHVQATRRIMYRLILRRGDDSQAKFAERIPVYGVKRERLKLLRRSDFDRPYLSDPIEDIRSVGKWPCRCLTVESESSFIVNDFVVHNSGGKDQALNTVKRLIGFRVRTLVARGSKEVRADEFSVQVNAGNVHLPEELREGGSWIGWAADFVDELRHFPFSTYKDIVDSSSGAVSLLVNRPQRCGALRRKQHA